MENHRQVTSILAIALRQASRIDASFVSERVNCGIQRVNCRLQGVPCPTESLGLVWTLFDQEVVMMHDGAVRRGEYFPK